MDLKRLAAEERADLAEFLATLSPRQWEEPTLCADWRVRDVVAHVISYDDLSVGGLAWRAVKGGFRPDRINALVLARDRDRSPEELLAALREHREPHGLPAAFGGMVALVDSVIHHQDIRRPLGLPRHIPAERLLRTLEGALKAPLLHASPRVRGLRLEATDLDWTTGSGPEVRGPAEALLMAIAGRHGVVDELSGPGRRVLAERIGS
jgi:uncharacterized protein (TIGR03083 family)